MAISVRLNNESDPHEIMLIDHINSETVRVPLNEVSDLVRQINELHYNETIGRMSDEQHKELLVESHSLNARLRKSMLGIS